MSLRIVAGETPRLCRSASALLPTGSFVEMKSSMMARNTSSLRCSMVTARSRDRSYELKFQLRAGRAAAPRGRAAVAGQ